MITPGQYWVIVNTEGWSWQKAAETISVQIALAIVHEQKTEPRVAGEDPY